VRRDGRAEPRARLQAAHPARAVRVNCYLGIDVGTGSARAGIYDSSGRLLGMGTHPLQLHRPEPDHVEQSSDDIWRACCAATRTAVRGADLDPAAIRGMGFDATCSLVLLDEHDKPVSVSST